MNGFTYESASPPNAEQQRFWNNELSLLKGFQQPVPVDCYEYVAANFKREVANCRLNEKLTLDYKYTLLSTLMTTFEWLRTKDGTEWLLKLYGIEQVEPHPGYSYFYEGSRLVEPEFSLRIYTSDRTQRIAMSPFEYYEKEALVVKMKDLLEYRRGRSDTPARHASDGMWAWVGSYVRNWLAETKADTTWPTTKPDRISGYNWAKGLMRAGSQTERVWNVISQLELHQERVYRIQKPAYVERFDNGIRRQVQPESPGILWAGRAKMRTVPLDELEKHMGVAPAVVEQRYRCASCGNIRCCISGGSQDRLCMNCRGVQLETESRPSLEWCRYRECRNCPEHLRNAEDLLNLANRLNTNTMPNFNR